MKDQPATPQLYEITVRGALDADWESWFGKLTLTHTEDCKGQQITILVGPIVDQAALRGILTTIWDMNMVLLSVRCL